MAIIIETRNFEKGGSKARFDKELIIELKNKKGLTNLLVNPFLLIKMRFKILPKNQISIFSHFRTKTTENEQ